MKTIRVLFLSAWFPDRTAPLNGDFVERQAIAVSEVTPTAVLHVAADPKATKRWLEVNRVYKNGLYEVIIYFRRSRCSLVNSLLYAAGYLVGYHDIRKSIGKPHLIHSNIIYKGALIAFIFRLFTRIPYIVSEHWTMYLHDVIPAKFRSRLLRYAVSKSSAVIPVTDNLAGALKRHGFGHHRIITVPNVVDTDLFSPGSTRASAQKMHVLHVSSMKEEHKNISGIIRTIRRLKTIRTDFIFTFAGNASPQQIALARDEGLTENEVVFTGEVDHPAVAALMKQSHMLVMFSNIENLPCVMLEALSCGIPVISTHVGGIHEWLTIREGLLIEPGNEDALLKAILHVMDHYNQYDPLTLHRYAAEHFSKMAVSQKLVEIYNSTLQHDGNA